MKGQRRNADGVTADPCCSGGGRWCEFRPMLLGVTLDIVTGTALFREQKASCPTVPSMWAASLGMNALALHGVPLGIPFPLPEAWPD